MAEAGLTPLDPVSRDCAYDLAWETARGVHVLEAKTTREDSEVQQMRLGLGQVIEYRTWLQTVSQKGNVTAHLLLSSPPISTRILAAKCPAKGEDTITTRTAVTT